MLCELGAHRLRCAWVVLLVLPSLFFVSCSATTEISGPIFGTTGRSSHDKPRPLKQLLRTESEESPAAVKQAAESLLVKDVKRHEQQVQHRHNTTEANCPTSLGPVEQHDGKSWAKVVNILNDRTHGVTGSTNNKLSDAQINSLRGSGLLRFVCDGIVRYVSDTEAFDSTARFGLYKCGSSPTGPFATSGTSGGQHHAIDCYNSEQDFTIYLHAAHQYSYTGCGGNSNGGKTGALYVECSSQADSDDDVAHLHW